MDAILLIRYGEIALKGKNRPFFEKKLEQNIKTALRGLEPFKLIFQRGRFFLHIGGGKRLFPPERVCRGFGNVSPTPA